MLSMTVPENDEGNAQKEIKDAKKAKNGAPMQHSPEELQGIADVIQKAHEHMADPILMDKLKPYMNKKVKALTGLAGLKAKASMAKMREAKKQPQETE